jgi:hypothetical protein
MNQQNLRAISAEGLNSTKLGEFQRSEGILMFYQFQILWHKYFAFNWSLGLGLGFK